MTEVFEPPYVTFDHWTLITIVRRHHLMVVMMDGDEGSPTTWNVLRTRVHWSGSPIHGLDHWKTTAWQRGAVVVMGGRSLL
jgi:hypothetical protein